MQKSEIADKSQMQDWKFMIYEKLKTNASLARYEQKRITECGKQKTDSISVTMDFSIVNMAFSIVNMAFSHPNIHADNRGIK